MSARPQLVRRSSRVGKVNIYNVLAAALVLGGCYFAYVWGPVNWDFLKLKEVCRASASQWHSTSNKDKAIARFDEHLRKQEVPEYIDASVCSWEERGGLRKIWCGYEVDVEYPMTGKYRTFGFEVITQVSKTGELTQY